MSGDGSDPVPPLGVAMIGHAFMGAVHSQAWRSAPRFFDLPVTPRMSTLCGRDPQRTAAAAARLGWEESTTDWRELLERPDIDLIDICTPSDTHADIAVAALRAGKHVLCEKPLANSVAEATRMSDAASQARAAGVHSMVAFNYRRVPALALSRRLIAQGKIGTIRHVRAMYLQDWLADSSVSMSWRLRCEQAGSGALGDIGAHILDAAQFVTGERLSAVCGTLHTFVPQRPGSSGAHEDVTVDDCAVLTGRFPSGALATFEATRYALGRKNAMRLEINGSRGSLSFDFESMNELWLYDGEDPVEQAGFRRILVTEPDHPYLENWWPPGHLLGYEHTFVHQLVDLLTAIGKHEPPEPSFEDGLYVQHVLEATQRSAARDSGWQQLAADGPVAAG